MQINRNAVDAKTRELRQHPAFAAAKAEFCDRIMVCWLETPLTRALIADTGAMAIAISIVGYNRMTPGGGASLQAMIATLPKHGFASATRIRAIVDLLHEKGAVEKKPHDIDRRRIMILPTDLLLASFRAWFQCVIAPVSRLFSLTHSAETLATIPGLVERYVTSIMLRQALDGFTIFDDWPEAQTFLDRKHGYALMLRLASAVGETINVPRAAFAQAYGVSPSHITAMLCAAEVQGWLRRDPQSNAVKLTPEFQDRLDLWVARELAIIGLWLEAKLGNC